MFSPMSMAGRRPPNPGQAEPVVKRPPMPVQPPAQSDQASRIA